MGNLSWGSPKNSKSSNNNNSSGGGGGGRGDQSRARELRETKARKDKATADAKASREEGQAKDARKAKAAANKRASDKAAYQAKVKRDAKAKNDLAALVAKEDKANKLKAYNANVKAVADRKAKEAAAQGRSDQAQQRLDQAPPKAPSFIDRLMNFGQPSTNNPPPSGAIWDIGRSPQERGNTGLTQTPQSNAFGMQGAGAYYPTGQDKTLELPQTAMGMLTALMNPAAAAFRQVSKVFNNQSNYGMNQEASKEYSRLLQDPSNAGMSQKDLVTLARKPQIDAQLPHAFIDGNPTTPEQKAIAAMTGGRAPSSTIYNGDGSVNMEATARTVVNQGAFTGPSMGDQLAVQSQEAPAVSPYFLNIDDYGVGQHSWAPKGNSQQPAMQPWAPTWNTQGQGMQQQRPSWAPKWDPQANVNGMLRAPPALQAPPSRWS